MYIYIYIQVYIFQEQRQKEQWQHMQIEPYFKSTSSILGAVASVFRFHISSSSPSPFARSEFVYDYILCDVSE